MRCASHARPAPTARSVGAGKPGAVCQIARPVSASAASEARQAGPAEPKKGALFCLCAGPCGGSRSRSLALAPKSSPRSAALLESSALAVDAPPRLAVRLRYLTTPMPLSMGTAPVGESHRSCPPRSVRDPFCVANGPALDSSYDEVVSGTTLQLVLLGQQVTAEGVGEEMDQQLDITDAGSATLEQEMERAGGSATADWKPAEANLGEGAPGQAQGTAENREEEKSIDEESDRADDKRVVPEKRQEGEAKTEAGADDMQESKGPELHEQAAGERQLKELASGVSSKASGVSSKALLTSSAVRWSLQSYPSWAVTGAQAHVLKYPVRAARLCAGLSAVLVR